MTREYEKLKSEHEMMKSVNNSKQKKSIKKKRMQDADLSDHMCRTEVDYNEFNYDLNNSYNVIENELSNYSMDNYNHSQSFIEPLPVTKEMNQNEV